MRYEITYKTNAGRIGTFTVFAFRPTQAAGYARIKLSSSGQALAKIIGIKLLK